MIRRALETDIEPIMAMAKDAAGETVIDLGQQDVTVSISVKWAIN